MIDLATWITGGVSAAAAVFSLIFARRADRAQSAATAAQREATQAAREAAESADRAQRVQVRPALRLEWDERAVLPGHNVPILLSRVAHNVGHGTASIERIRLLENGNLRVDFHDTRGTEQRLIEQFDELFEVLMGVRMGVIPVELTIPPLTDADRGLEIGASRVLFELRIPGAHARRILERFREQSSAQVIYRSLAGEEFNTEQQFADVREERHPHAIRAAPRGADQQ
jgi:hypothetical protein